MSKMVFMQRSWILLRKTNCKLKSLLSNWIRKTSPRMRNLRIKRRNTTRSMKKARRSIILRARRSTRATIKNIRKERRRPSKRIRRKLSRRKRRSWNRRRIRNRSKRKKRSQNKRTCRISYKRRIRNLKKRNQINRMKWILSKNRVSSSMRSYSTCLKLETNSILILTAFQSTRHPRKNKSNLLTDLIKRAVKLYLQWKSLLRK